MRAELDRLRKPGEIEISDELALKLKMMSSATIDRKLRHKRENLYPSALALALWATSSLATPAQLLSPLLPYGIIPPAILLLPKVLYFL